MTLDATGRLWIDELDEPALRVLAERLAPFLRDVEPDGLLTPHEAARRAGAHVETVRRATRSGALPARHVGRSVRIAPDDLDAWLARPRERAARPDSRRRGRSSSRRRPLASALETVAERTR